MIERVCHTLQPVYDSNSKVLILGSMPSPKSRELGFYYGHPQNRFWRVISEIFSEEVPVSNEEKRALVLRRHIALWDVLASCEIKGADDASIKNPIPNDFREILKACSISAVFTTGTTATKMYRKFCYPQTGIQSIALPSTSPANCRHYQYPDLVDAYRVILKYI